MAKRSLILFPIFLLVISTGFSQGRGGRQGQGQGQSANQRQGQGQLQGQGQGQRGVQAGSADMEHKRIKATQQQRDQIRSCDKLADGIRKQARKIAKASGNKYNAEEATRQRNQIREQFTAMEQEHERLVNGLDSNQQQAWQEQVRTMNQLRQEVHSQLLQMNNEMGMTQPDAKRIAERAREIEQNMNSWRKQYNTLSSQASY
jgi:hypothetical protein